MLSLSRNLHSDATLTLALLSLRFKLSQRLNVPVLGTSRYQARYSSRALRLASFRSRLKIGLTTLAAPAAARVAAVDAMTAVVTVFPVEHIHCSVTALPPSGWSVSQQPFFSSSDMRLCIY